MIEKVVKNLDDNKNIIVNIQQNEYALYNKYESHKSIIGYFTDSIATCSLFLISINFDEYLFFSHIDEDSNIIEIIEQKIIPILSNVILNNILIIYSRGIGPISNIKKDYHINEAIDKIDTIFKSEKKIYEHKNIISCLKLIRSSQNDNKTLMNKIIKFQSSLFKNINAKLNKSPVTNVDLNNLFDDSILYDDNIIFYFEKILENLLYVVIVVLKFLCQ